MDAALLTNNKRARPEIVRTPHLSERFPDLDAKHPIGPRAASGVPYSQIISNDAGVYAQVLTPTHKTAPSELDRVCLAYLRAGPRATLFFDPGQVVAGIVTCGGLCPGLNSVIMAICKSLFELYGAARVVGFQGGYGGIYSRPVRELTLANTTGIQNRGGTILTSARGGFDSGKILAKLEELGVRQLFVVGGDGTMRGAHELSQIAALNAYPVAIIGLPKTIDNDIDIIDRSFGFECVCCLLPRSRAGRRAG
jgi:6-phosphofructokinase 1